MTDISPHPARYLLTRRELREGWTVEAAAGPIPNTIAGKVIAAEVPGSVHTDLLAAGLIGDPYLDANEYTQKWIGLSDFTYCTSFTWVDQGHERIELLFEGLDTVATVTLNGCVLGSTRNMHRRYGFEVRDLLREGENDVVVEFASPIKYADSQSVELGYRPHTNHHPYNAIRKMACSFGWDWGPDTATSAIWKPVLLESWSTARLSEVRPIAIVNGTTGELSVHTTIARSTHESVSIAVTLNGERIVTEVASGAESLIARAEIPEVQLWWPRGMGQPTCYTVKVELLHEGRVLDSISHRVGFRTVEIQSAPDNQGTSFVLQVNGKAVTVRGANWIPDDAFLHRVTPDRLRSRLDQAEFARINLLRVWGGGVYESDSFYDLCDERGMLTWQDFLFACAAYAEEEPLAGEIEAEARENVSRLAHHPSLIMWNGNNENLWGFEDWKWQPRLDGKTWGAGYYLSLLPNIVEELSPHIPYTPGSPHSPDKNVHPNDPDQGTMHIWDVWNKLDYTAYAEKRPRFVAEFGWQGPPTWSTLTRSVSDSPLTQESPGMLVHQKATEGNVKLIDGLVPHLRLPDDMDDWHWAMSLNQAVAVRFGIEHFRSLQPHCSGTIMWQLNDCWPVTSWAAVDGDGRPKPLLYALRSANADHLVTLQPRGGVMTAVVVNDGQSEWQGDLLVERRSFAGEVLAWQKIDVQAQVGSAHGYPLDEELLSASNPAGEYLRAELDGVVTRRLFVEWRESTLAPPQLETRLESDGATHLFHVRATTSLVCELSLLVDRLAPDSVVNQMLVTLDAGESTVFEFTTSNPIDENGLRAGRVLRSVNDLVANRLLGS